MTFNPAIPQPGDALSQSQAQIQTNFSQSDLIFDINHVTFDSSLVASRGKHRKVDFLQVAAPGSIATEAVVYQKLAGGSSNLFMQRDASPTEIQLTGPTPVIATVGSSFLPGGVIMNWGVVLCAVGANAPQNFATAFPAALLSVTLSCQNTVQSQQATAVATQTNITIYSSAIQPVYYIAIGI